jgi:hypothetical protein
MSLLNIPLDQDPRLEKVQCSTCKNLVYRIEEYQCKGPGGTCHHGGWPGTDYKPDNWKVHTCRYCTRRAPKMDNC